MKYRFSDLADIPKLQELMGSLYWLTDIAIGIIEADGTFLFCAGWRGLCTAGTQKICDCHAYISTHLDPVSYTCRQCPTGMMHYACPIVVEGEHLASVYIGGFFTEPPDEVSVSLDASNRGLDPAEYRKALGKFSVIPPMRLTLLLKYLKDQANMLAGIGLQRLQQMEALNALRLNEERLHYLSCHDPLTDLQNRISFEEGLTAMDNDSTLPVALMIMDLDGLKHVNDSLGHPAGDSLLCAAAKILSESAPPESTVSRIGGDEFAILLPNANRNTIKNIQQRIFAEIEQYNSASNHPALGLSIGFAVADAAPFTMRELFKEADADMYRNKGLRSQQKPGGNEPFR